MSKFRIVDVCYDVVNECLRDLTGARIKTDQYPRIYFREVSVLRLRLVTDGEDLPTPYTDLVEGLTYSASVDNDFSPATELMCKTVNENINKEGDWSDSSNGNTADPTIGQLSIRVDANTVQYQDRIGTIERLINTKFEVKAFNEDNDLVAVFRFPLYCYNIQDDNANVPLSSTVQWRLSPTTGLLQFWNPDTQLYHSFTPRGVSPVVGTDWDQNGEV